MCCPLHSVFPVSIFVSLFRGREPLRMCNPVINYVLSQKPDRLVMKGSSHLLASVIEHTPHLAAAVPFDK